MSNSTSQFTPSLQPQFSEKSRQAGAGGNSSAVRQVAVLPTRIPRLPAMDNLALEERLGQVDRSCESLSSEVANLNKKRRRLYGPKKKVSDPNSRMLAKLTKNSLGISFNMQKPINAGNCNQIFLSTNGQYIIKPIPIYTEHSAETLANRCIEIFTTIQAQNTEFTYGVAKSVCELFPGKRNPFLEPHLDIPKKELWGLLSPLLKGLFHLVPSVLSIYIY
jgi:hypothetical protein